MGHGGTLDPMATGVLILGVGSGTKTLNSFLQCTKSYETVVLFGAATDTYDAVGKIVARKDYSHITKEIVEEALGKFRGEILQKPPIYSALKVNGKKMYEYAREGKELPIDIEARPVEVLEMEMLEWYGGGQHDFYWPAEEAPQQEKEVVDKALQLEDGGADTGTKRKRDEDEVVDGAEASESSPKRVRPDTNSEPAMSGALPANSSEPTEQATPSARCPAPACRLRMTSTSGFYVRSLAHDLGAAVGSLGLMSTLVRSRQGDFSLGEKGSVLDYDDLGKGEEVWGEKVEAMLKDWESKAGEREVAASKEEEDGAKPRQREGGGGKKHGESGSGKKEFQKPKRRRNSSSSEG